MGVLVAYNTSERKSHYALYGKKYYEANKEKINQRSKRNYEKTRELKLVKHRHHVLKSRYGITMEDYYKMLEAQNNKCAVCKIEATKTLDVDHDHNTGKVRGLLCNNCNRGLGHLKDSITNLQNAIDYLDKADKAQFKYKRWYWYDDREGYWDYTDNPTGDGWLPNNVTSPDMAEVVEFNPQHYITLCCGDEIWSRYPGEFVQCKCKEAFVDQTEYYTRGTINIVLKQEGGP